MLSIISTPIGNLGDITLRSIETLKACDAIVCEDTRVTGMLLKHLELPKKELISYHGHSGPQRVEQIIERLQSGEHIALVSDAGTPGISDPGAIVISRAREEELDCEVLPGPSACLAALSASGLATHTFVYMGFLPAKKGRKTVLESLKDETRTIVFYESVHRISRTLLELSEVLASQPDREVVIARELTKMYEEVIRTTVKDVKDIQLKEKGEFVVIIGPAK